MGKTHLAVALIRHFSLQAGLLALKISPHTHDQLGKVSMVYDQVGYRLFLESEVHGKNSGQFLLAGASSSYFLETVDGSLNQAIISFSEEINPLGAPVVCESGALGTIIRPGVMVFIDDQDQPSDPYKESIKKFADIVLPARQFLSAELINRIVLTAKGWRIKYRGSEETKNR